MIIITAMKRKYRKISVLYCMTGKVRMEAQITAYIFLKVFKVTEKQTQKKKEN